MERKFINNLLIRTASAVAIIGILAVLFIFVGIKVAVVFAGIILSAEILSLFTKKLTSKQRCMALFYLMLIYFVLFIIYLIGLTYNGITNLVTVLTIVAFTDIGAYIFGSLCKGPKLCPKISPSKTISGALFGVATPVFVYWIIINYLTVFPLIVIPMYHVIVIAILAAVGDLFESALKRYFKIKDFANIIPGHGGLLDRFDSAMFAVIYFYYIVM